MSLWRSDFVIETMMIDYPIRRPDQSLKKSITRRKTKTQKKGVSNTKVNIYIYFVTYVFPSHKNWYDRMVFNTICKIFSYMYSVTGIHILISRILVKDILKYVQNHSKVYNTKFNIS